MLRIVLFLIILLHGLIHFMGFAKAFGYGNAYQLKIHVSKTAGAFWLVIALLFIIVSVLYLLNKQSWWIIAIPAALLSQVVIIMSWQDAKAGTVINIIILITSILSFTGFRFENRFRNDVKENILHNNTITNELLTEKDIAHLPIPVQKYLRYAGVINKPKIKNVHILFEGRMRDKRKGWFSFTSEQFNFFDEPARLFFMKGKMFGITVPGYHCYHTATAIMDIRLFGIIPLIKKCGAVLNKTETVTFFNDMCLVAPAALIDENIKWQTINDYTVAATFTNHNISVKAELFFNEQYQLINFISHDRTDIGRMKQYPFITPVSGYKNFNGYKIMSYGESIWRYPGGDFTYGQFNLKSIEYNIGLQKHQ